MMTGNSTLPEYRISATKFADTILDISILLLESGAHCERINRNIQRLAKTNQFKVEMLLTFTAISVTVTDDNDPENAATINKRVKHHGAHFGILTNTSLFTWDVFNKKVKPEDFSSHIKTLKSVKKHPVWLVRTFIGVACGCLCMLAGGDWKNGVIAAIAAFAGLTVRQIMVKHNFNLMIAIVSAAFISTSIAGIDILFHIGQYPERTVATSVLYLIPGVPLINCIIDLIEGYIPTALARGAFGGFILLCIAVGMFLSMNIIGINNF